MTLVPKEFYVAQYDDGTFVPNHFEMTFGKKMKTNKLEDAMQFTCWIMKEKIAHDLRIEEGFELKKVVVEFKIVE